VGGAAVSQSFSSLTSSKQSETNSDQPNKSFFSFSNIATAKTDSSKLFGGGLFSNALNPAGPLFGGSTVFGGAAAASTAVSADAEGGDDEHYEPPKPETCDLQEEGAVFTKRLKLFYYKESEAKFCDRGIGNLYLKPSASGDKTQLLIRADTKLGNILLNVNLSKSIPINKLGAKDVSIICIAHPEIPEVSKDKPCKFLFKVKTEEDAQELTEKLNEYKR
jgi:nuclear pore complex protein Nup50